MSEQRIWTADELLALSPGERAEVVRAGIVTDPLLVSPDLLDRARKKIDDRIALEEATEAAID